MTRAEKYELDRAMIGLESSIGELDALVQDLIDYCHELEMRQMFDNLMDSPMNKIQELINEIQGGHDGT